MKAIGVFLFLLCFSYSPAFALTPVEEGVKAYQEGDLDKAEKLLQPYANQPVFAKLLRIIKAYKNQGKGKRKKRAAEINKMRKGKTDLFDKYGMVAHAPKKSVQGISGSLRLNTLAAQAKAGHAQQAYVMGLFFQDGVNVPVNFHSAIAYFSKASDKKHAEAQNNLGFFYRYGIGTDKNEEKAAELFTSSLSNGNAKAAYNLALLHYDGIKNKTDMMKAYLYADVACELLAGKKETRENHATANSLRKKAAKKLTKLQIAYLKKYVPDDIKNSLPETFLEKRTSSPFLPAPPADGKIIRQTDFMFPVERTGFFQQAIYRDPEEASDKELEPFLPPVFNYDETAAVTKVFEDKNITPPAPFPEEKEVLDAVYFRPALPRSFHLTLNKSKSGMPLMVGDVVNLTIYTKLYESNASQKGAGKTLKNSQYSFTHEKNGTLDVMHPVLNPVSEDTKNSEAFIAITARALRAGRNILRFTPLDEEDFEYVFILNIHPKPAEPKKKNKKSKELPL